MRFRDREQAGRVLAQKLGRYAEVPGVVVLGLPRGGVPVAARVASALGAPLDVVCVRKLGVPDHPELAMGAIAEGDVRVLDAGLVAQLGISEAAVATVEARERDELARQAARYRTGRVPVDLSRRTAVVVDVDAATGATMRAAARAVRQRQPARLIIAVPVAAESSCQEMKIEADEVVCALTPAMFFGVGQFYEDFRQTSDDEVRELLGRDTTAG